MKNKKIFVVICQVVLGLLFIYAGVRKMLDPAEFADAIAGFRFLPDLLIHPVALSIPVLEIILGIMVMLPTSWRNLAKHGAYGIILLNIAFIILLLSAWMRDLSVECGCFGLGIFPPSEWTLQIAIVRDIVFLAMAYIIHLSKGYSKDDTIYVRN